MDKKHPNHRLIIPERINFRLTPLIHEKLQWLADRDPTATDYTDLLRHIIYAYQLEQANEFSEADDFDRDVRTARSKRKA